ncbi:two-component regulator propeller domain-containing protein [Bacteroides sp. GM023]|uniref:two-component regulator propeller domain-containing protein n=1 Tax=Bacteroides sp. GM023 TaxID=2723058 RepID=UPI00168A9FA6|nr:two-component regulator propeller domain-containing protein [Bacteroides sp. GM023]MBD3587922.1 response regulator [Bacteroides sp. GM023]
MKTLFFFCCHLLLAAFTFVNAQTGRFYSTDKDLSNSLINKVYQDKRGFIWVATEDGLNKFDGNRFIVYKKSKNEPDALLNNYVKTLFEDSKGRFWIACINGIQIYDQATHTFQSIPIRHNRDNMAPQTSANIIELQNGEIWLGTYGGGIISLKENEFIPQEELNRKIQSYFIQTIYEDSKQNIWIATENKGLFCYTPSNGQVQNFTAPGQLTSEDISCFCEDKEGTLFISTLNGGLMKLNPSNSQFTPIPYKGNNRLSIKTLTIDNNNNLYIGTEGFGLKIYNRSTNSIDDYDVHNGVFDLSSSKVHSILEDKDGNLWLGIFQKGLLMIPSMPNKFNYYGYKSFPKSEIGSSCVMSILVDRQNVAWIATDNDGLYAVNDEGKQILHFKEEGSNRSAPRNIICLLEDSEHKLWIGSYLSGLTLMNKQTGVCTPVNEQLSTPKASDNKKIFCIAEDRNQHIWVGTYGSGVYKMDISGKVINQYQSSKSQNENWQVNKLCNDWINCIIEDNEGLLWIGTCNGLSCFNPKTENFINYLSQNNLLPNTFVHTLLQDDKGFIWVGTSEGLYKFDKRTQKFSIYTTQQGLPSDVICGMVQDDMNNYWISTHQGMSKLIADTETFINYTASDGIQGNEFTRGAFYKDHRGKIYFGGTGGVTSFYPKDIAEPDKKLRIEITDFILGNHSVRKGDMLGKHAITDSDVMDATRFTLTYEQNSFRMELSTLDFANPERIIYQYKIKELETNWLNTSPGMNRVSYANLSPGTYTLMVRAKDNKSTSDIRTVEIVVTPPWYNTWWAKVLWSCLLVLVLYALTMYVISRIHRRQEIMKQRHQEQINEAKLQFFINISHEIRTPMTLIISPLEKLIAEHSEKQQVYLMIYRNAQRILRLINQLMDIRKLDKGQMHLKFRETDMVGFIEDLMQTFNYQAQKKNITFTFDKELPDADSLKVWIDLNNFDKVLMNVLSNAFKYTSDGGNIHILLKTGHNSAYRGALKDYFEICVTDDGIGIDKDKIKQIFERFYQINNDMTQSNFGTGIGLHLARSLVKLHHGLIKAENREDEQGTRFIIRLPLGSDHLKTDELENPDEAGSDLLMSQLSKDTLYETDNENAMADEVKKPKAKTRYRVLIIEDDDEIRQYMRNELNTDFRISECTNGREGLEVILRDKPDLVISDIMMPEMDGITLCRKVKQNININHIPVILLTAKSKAEDRIEGLETGADAYIVKPFNTEILRTTASNLIANRERLRGQLIGEQQVEEKIVKIEMKSNDEILMGKVMKTINEHLTDPALNVEMLAANVGMSRVHMHRKLKELTNQSARDFIRNIRLKQAATLLREKNLSISEVAYATGFSNLSHFSNSFREFYGISPTEYKEQPDVPQE